MKDYRQSVGEHWSKITQAQSAAKKLKVRWWQCPRIVQHINRLVCGEPISGFSHGLEQLVRQRAAGKLPFERGVSVGCGAGQKEIRLIKGGVVERFDLYEFSETRIAAGRSLVHAEGLESRVRFVNGDAFELVREESVFDFVHWNNSLHHMPDVDQAVAWSRHVLKPGGMFYMDDFIGPSRFQWPDQQLAIASRVRRVFEGSRFMRNPKQKDGILPTEICRPSVAAMVEMDPSEAADSSRIVEAIRRHFPNAQFKATGGAIYHLALNDLLANFDEAEDRIVMDLLLLLDELCIELGHTHYGVALAIKEE